MSIYHFQTCLSREFTDTILEQLADKKNQNFMNKSIIDPLLDNAFYKLRSIVITFFVLFLILILLNTLIILQFIYNRKRLYS